MNQLPNLQDVEQQEASLKECHRLAEDRKLLGIVMAAANETVSFEEAAQYVLNAVCLFAGWEIGHLYIRQKDEFVPADVWFMSDKERFSKVRDFTMKTVLKGNEGFLGHIFKNQNPVWLSEFFTELDFLRKDILLQNGIRSAVGLPIIVEQKVVAVLEFFNAKPQPFDYRLMGILDQIKLELGRTFERFSAKKKLQRENILLRLTREITAIAKLSETPDKAFRMAIEKICLYTGWPVGHVYILKQHYPDMAEILVPSRIWYLENPEKFKVFKEVTERTTFALSIGLPGRVWADKKSHWIINVQKDPNFPRAKLAKDIGVKGAFGFPVFSSAEKVIAVLEFFSTEEEEEEEESEFLGVMADIGVQLGRVIERDEARRNIIKLNELRNKFIQIVSHQLRMPLNSIRWNLEALLAEEFGKLKNVQKEFLRITYEANIEVIRRIHDLLTAMDIEEGRVITSKEDISLESLWGSVMSEWKKKCAVKDITCEYQPPKEPLPSAEVDAEKIREVFNKLTENAVIYTPNKGKITATLKKTDGTVRFEIIDTGIGIPKAEQSHIFTRFYRATNAPTMKPDASGLGLAISKYYMEQHGGKIGFESEEGKGSTFWFELPVK